MTPYDGIASLIHNIQDVYEAHQEVVGIAISMPGIINSKEGIAVTAGALKYIENGAVFGTGFGGGLVINHQFVEGLHHSQVNLVLFEKV